MTVNRDVISVIEDTMDGVGVGAKLSIHDTTGRSLANFIKEDGGWFGRGLGPRPLDFIRIRLKDGPQVAAIQEILEDTRDDLFEDLKKLRNEGKREQDAEVLAVAEDIRHINEALHDIYNGRVEF